MSTASLTVTIVATRFENFSTPQSLRTDAGFIDWMLVTPISEREIVSNDLQSMGLEMLAAEVSRAAILVDTSINETLRDASKNSTSNPIIVVKPGEYTGVVDVTIDCDIVGHPGSRREEIVVRSTKNCFLLRPPHRATVSHLLFHTVSEKFNGVICSLGEIRIIDCDARSDGFATIATRGVNTKVTVADTKITSASKGGIVATENSVCRIDRCIVTNCPLQGVEVRLGSEVFLTDTDISHCGQSGIFVDQASCSVTGCRIVQNGQCGIRVQGTITLVDTSINNNSKGIHFAADATPTDMARLRLENTLVNNAEDIVDMRPTTL